MSSAAASPGRLIDDLLAGRTDPEPVLSRTGREEAERLALELEKRFFRCAMAQPSEAALVAGISGRLARRRRAPRVGAVADRLAGTLALLEGRPGPAAARLERAVRRFTAAGDWLRAGDVERVLVDVRMQLDQHAEARRAATRARRCYRRAGGADPRRLGSLAMNLGNLHHRRDEHGRALAAYAEARRWFRRARQPLRMARVDYNRANILLTLGRRGEARRLYQSAREAFADSGQVRLALQAAYALAGVDLEEGRLDAALERLDALAASLEKLPDAAGAAHADLDASMALLRLQRPVEARDRARCAESFFRRRGFTLDRLRAVEVLAGAALQLGRAAEARRRAREGMGLARSLGNSFAAASLAILLARAEAAAGRPEEGERLARDAGRFFGRRGLLARQATALASAADAALAAGAGRRARALADRAASLARRRHHDPALLTALFVLAREAAARGARDEAYRRWRSAATVVERMRAGLGTEESLLAFARLKLEVYEALIADRLARGGRRNLERALEYVERSKARVLADLLARRADEEAPRGPGGRILARIESLERELASATERETPGPDAEGFRTVPAARIGRMLRERETLLERLERRSPVRGKLLAARPLPFSAARAELEADEVVLEYVEVEGAYHLFVIRPERVELFRDLLGSPELARETEQLRFLLGKGALGRAHLERHAATIGRALRSRLGRLGRRLLPAGLVGGLAGRAVRIVPHGLLHGVPFHALESAEGIALLDGCREVSYAPSLTLLILARRLGRSGRFGAPPVVVGSADRLAPAIDQEVRLVQSRLGQARLRVGSAVGRESLAEAADKAALLHVASHASYAEWARGGGSLRLGSEWASMADIHTLPATAGLVVLSGCQTGRGTVLFGDEWIGLVRGFLHAGAASVVATQWEVEDRTTVRTMANFYEHLAAGEAVGACLTEALRATRRATDNPLLWAPFFLVGDPGYRLSLGRKAA